MEDLIEALIIFKKYQGGRYAPTHCEHDVLYIMGVEKNDPSDKELERLEELGFHRSENCWQSYRFGSA